MSLYYSPLYYGFDATYIPVLIGFAVCMMASIRMRSTYSKYARVRSMSGMTGFDVANKILRMNGINDVTVERGGNDLTDHYDPGRKVVRLSYSTYSSNSIASVAVAAHECGHVLQHHKGYVPLSIRSSLVPVANIGSNFGIMLVIIGLIIGHFQPLITAGIFLFSGAVLFQLITLPVEFDASSRALVMLRDYGILGGDEEISARELLSAAALTYVASAAAGILQLLRLVLLSGRRRR